jgi:enoyl-CoA hydratase/carnithine racemase
MTAVAAAPVFVHDDGGVRTVTLNRPEKRNAIDLELRVALADAIEAADADPDVRVIVLTGAGPAFCSGGDITTMKRLAPGPALERAQLAQRVIRAIWSTPQPVLAAVEGSAFGAGTALAAACDRIVAARDARFATTSPMSDWRATWGPLCPFLLGSGWHVHDRCCCSRPRSPHPRRLPWDSSTSWSNRERR